MLALDLPRSAQPDVAVEALDLEVGAARADREAEAVLGRAGDVHGEARVEIAVEGGDGDGQVGPLRHAHGHVAIGGGEAVTAPVLDGAVVLEVAVGSADFAARGLDPPL